MVTSKYKRRGTAIAIFCAPVALIKLVAVIAGAGGPMQANADESSPIDLSSAAGATPQSVRTVEATPEQLAAMEYVSALAGRGFGASPLYYPSRASTTVQSVNPDEVAVDVTEDLIQVQSIVTSERGESVLISGEVYSIGDILPDSSWQIIRIDARTGAVDFRDLKSGEVASRTVPKHETRMRNGGN